MSEEVTETVENVRPTRTAVKADLSRDYLDEIRDLREENKNHRLKSKELEQQLADQSNAHKVEIAQVQDQMSKTEQANRAKVAIAELKAIAAKEGLVDLDALKLLDHGDFKYAESGELINGVEVLEAFKTAKPFFFGSTATASSFKPPSPAPTKSDTVMDLDKVSWEREKAKFEGLR